MRLIILVLGWLTIIPWLWVTGLVTTEMLQVELTKVTSSKFADDAREYFGLAACAIVIIQLLVVGTM